MNIRFISRKGSKKMIELLEGGAYLVNGKELVSDNAEATAQIKAKTGKEVSK